MTVVQEEQASGQKQGERTSSGATKRSRAEDPRQRAREDVARIRKEAETRKMDMEDEIARLHRAEEMARIELDEAIEKLRAEEDAIRERTQEELDRLRAREDSILDSLEEEEEREWARRRRVEPSERWRDDPLWDLPSGSRGSSYAPARLVDEGSNLARAYTLASMEQLRLVTDAIRSITDSVVGRGDPYAPAGRRTGLPAARTRSARRRGTAGRASSRSYSRRGADPDDVYAGVADTLERAIEIPARTLDRFYDVYTRG